MLRNLTLIVLLFFFIQQIFSSLLYGQNQLKSYSFQEVDSLRDVYNKPLVVFLYTDWCKYCELMKETSLKNKEVKTILDSSFYYVPFNAEEKKSIKFSGIKYDYQPEGNNTGKNQLSVNLGTIEGKLSFPTICILNQKNEIIYRYSGYLNSENLKAILKTILL